MAEAAARQIINRMQPPIGALAARLAQAAAIGHAQTAARPPLRLATGATSQQPVQHAGQKIHRPVQPLIQRLGGHLGHAVQVGPGRGLLRAHAAGAAGQAQSQQGRTVDDAIAATALHRPGGTRQLFEVKVGREPGRKLGPGLPGGGCSAQHGRCEPYRSASVQALFSLPGAYPDAYGGLARP
jgi:hypothetical protein